jgi:hypothetical protein
MDLGVIPGNHINSQANCRTDQRVQKQGTTGHFPTCISIKVKVGRKGFQQECPLQRYSQSIYGYYQYRDKPASLIHILFFMFEGAKILNFTLHHILSMTDDTAQRMHF